jgi:hypothetical protein
MKMTILVLTNILLSVVAFAGGNGSGTMSMTAAGLTSPSQEFVKFEGMDRSEIVFQYGVANARDEVFTRRFRLRAEELPSDRVLGALKASRTLNQWIEIK